MRNRVRDKVCLCIGASILISFAVMAYASSGFSPIQKRMDKRQWAEIVLKDHYRVSDYQQLAEVVATASDTENVPVEAIIAIMKVESNFDPQARSRCHAKGLMQVRPDVWDGNTPYNMYDHYENVLAGAYVLSQYNSQTGSIDGAIRAYNVGITHYLQGRAVHAGNRYHSKVQNEIKTIKASYPTELSLD